MKYYALYRRRKSLKAVYPAGTHNHHDVQTRIYTQKYQYHHWPRDIRIRYKDLLWFRFKYIDTHHTLNLMRRVYGTPQNIKG